MNQIYVVTTLLTHHVRKLRFEVTGRAVCVSVKSILQEMWYCKQFNHNLVWSDISHYPKSWQCGLGRFPKC